MYHWKKPARKEICPVQMHTPQTVKLMTLCVLLHFKLTLWCNNKNNIFFIKSTRKMWAGNVAYMGRGILRVLVVKPEWKKPLSRRRNRWEDNIRINFQKSGCGGMDFIKLAANCEFNKIGTTAKHFIITLKIVIDEYIFRPFRWSSLGLHSRG